MVGFLDTACYKNAEGTSIADNQVNVFINEGKVQYMKVYQHKISKPIDVEVSVDHVLLTK